MDMPTEASRPTMDHDKLIQLVQQIYNTHIEQVDCETCEKELDCLAELVVDGYDADDVLPAVQHHLSCCKHCHELYDGLLLVLKAQQAGAL